MTAKSNRQQRTYAHSFDRLASKFSTSSSSSSSSSTFSASSLAAVFFLFRFGFIVSHYLLLLLKCSFFFICCCRCCCSISFYSLEMNDCAEWTFHDSNLAQLLHASLLLLVVVIVFLASSSLRFIPCKMRTCACVCVCAALFCSCIRRSHSRYITYIFFYILFSVFHARCTQSTISKQEKDEAKTKTRTTTPTPPPPTTTAIVRANERTKKIQYNKNLK